MDAKDLICGYAKCGCTMKRHKTEEFDKNLTFVTYKCPNGHIMIEGRRSNPQSDYVYPWFGVPYDVYG